MENIINLGEFLDLETAKEKTDNFRNQNPGKVYANMIGKLKLIAMLEQLNCNGIRIYKAVSNAGEEMLVLTSVDADGKDMADDLLIGASAPCPPMCDNNSPLNNI